MAVKLLQEHPALSIWMWRLLERLLRGMSGPMRRLGLDRSSRTMAIVEGPVKGILFSCQMCGQCVLHRTGMTCPMTCPKEIRNGPCGGVCLDGTCEVDGTTPCVWVQAVTRAEKTPWADEIGRLNPPVDWRLEGMSSWATYALGRDEIGMSGDAECRYAADVVRPLIRS